MSSQSTWFWNIAHGTYFKTNEVVTVSRGAVMKWIGYLGIECRAWLAWLVFAIPGNIGQAARHLWCLVFLRFWGESARASQFIEIIMPANISVGARTRLGRYNYLNADGGTIRVGEQVNFNERVHVNASVGGHIEIGNNCLIGPGVVMRTASHNFDDPHALIREQGHAVGSITLEDDVWLASNCVILPGVTIGRGSIIAAGSVVNRDVQPMGVYGGVPATLLKNRGSSDC